MPLLYSVNGNGKIVLDKVVVKLCPKLKLLSDKQVEYIVLAYCYDSKYRQFPTDQKKDKARYEVFGPNADDPEYETKMKNGILEYRSLQYDDRRETIITYKDKAASLRLRLVHLEEYRDIENTMKSIDLFEKKMRDIQNELDSDFKAVELVGGGRLSLLESLQGNMHKFNRDVVRKTAD